MKINELDCINNRLSDAEEIISQQAEQINELEAEISRLKTVPMKYRRMEFNAQLQQENAKLEARCAELEQRNADWRNGGYTSLWKLRTEDRDKTIESQRLILMDLRDKLAAKQARIDELMLEYCPDEITTEQLEEYEKHQLPVSEDQKDAEQVKWLFNQTKAYVMRDDNNHPVISFLPVTLRTCTYYKSVAEYIEAAMAAELEKGE